MSAPEDSLGTHRPHQHGWRQWIILSVWGFFLTASVVAFWRSGLSAPELPDAIRRWIAPFGRTAPALFILLFAVRPLVIMPVSVLCLASGLLWGPLWGSLWALLGDNISAWSAFWLARWLGKAWLHQPKNHLLLHVERYLREHSFMAVLILRLIYLPFDLVNFACGLSGMPFRPFAAATFFGVLPSVITFVYFGSSWLDPKNLLITAAIFLSSLLVARLVHLHPMGQKVHHAMKKSSEGASGHPDQ